MQSGALRMAFSDGSACETRQVGIGTLTVLTRLAASNTGLTVLVIGGIVTLTLRLGEISGQSAQILRCFP